MEPERDFNILFEKIYIIIRKTALPGFDFQSDSRQWDGFTLVTSGRATYCGEGGRTVGLSAGDMVLLSRGEKYRVFSDTAFTYVTTAYDVSVFSGSKADFPKIYTCTKEEVGEILQMAKEWQARSWEASCLCQSALLRLYVNILRTENSRRIGAADEDVARACEYIRRHCIEGFRCAELAAACAVSESYLRTKFRRETGHSFGFFRDSLRISSACEMLESGLFSAAETGSHLGFYDASHFERVFKKHMGISAGEYKKQGAPAGNP